MKITICLLSALLLIAGAGCRSGRETPPPQPAANAGGGEAGMGGQGSGQGFSETGSTSDYGDYRDALSNPGWF